MFGIRCWETLRQVRLLESCLQTLFFFPFVTTISSERVREIERKKGDHLCQTIKSIAPHRYIPYAVKLYCLFHWPSITLVDANMLCVNNNNFRLIGWEFLCVDNMVVGCLVRWSLSDITLNFRKYDYWQKHLKYSRHTRLMKVWSSCECIFIRKITSNLLIQTHIHIHIHIKHFQNNSTSNC